MIKGDDDQTYGYDVLAPVSTSCRDCQMGLVVLGTKGVCEFEAL